MARVDPHGRRLRINQRLSIPLAEIQFRAVRAQGPGGQNVNKVASAVHLRFDLNASSLPPAHRRRLLALGDQRISKAGVLVIKAQGGRSQEQNRREALERLRELLASTARTPRKRIRTRPTRASQRRRVEHKKRLGRLKALRGRVRED